LDTRDAQRSPVSLNWRVPRVIVLDAPGAAKLVQFTSKSMPELQQTEEYSEVDRIARPAPTR
jgi:hypothetical protein